MKKSRFVCALLSLMFTLAASAQPAAPAQPAASSASESKEPPRKNELSEILDSMGYPELQVVPRASERLAIEAKNEDATALVMHWPMEVSGLATLVVSFANRGARRTNLTDKETKDAGSIAGATSIVGAGWLIGGIALGLQRPYRSASSMIKKYDGKDERSVLLRERLAEEALEKPARTIRILNNAAVLSCGLSNLASAWHANENGKVTAGVGLLLSMMPWFFEDHTIEVYDKHIEYKKKIYTPLKSAYFSYDSKNKEFVPMTAMAWEF